MNNTGFNLKEVNTFKRYPGYEGLYIIDYYIRDKFSDSVYSSYNDLIDGLVAMEDLNLWDDCYIGYVLEDGTVSFHLEL